MDTHPREPGARILRRLRSSRGWSWDVLAEQLRQLARQLQFGRIASASNASVKRTIARWEAARSTPDEQYRVLLAHAYARTPLDRVELGPGSDFRELLDALALMGVGRQELTDLQVSVATSVTDSGMNLLAYLGGPLRTELADALAHPDTIDMPVLDELNSATEAINQQIGSAPFVRLHLAQAAVVDACRQLLSGEQPGPVRTRLRQISAGTYALAARLAFETHDDAAAMNLYDEAVSTAPPTELSQRALIRTSQTMVVYYATRDIAQARRIVDAAVRDARRGPSVLMRARAHALQAEMAARGEPPQERHAQAALRLAWMDLDADASGDPLPVFSNGRLRGFEGICGIFLGQAEAAEKQLATSAGTLLRPRETVQRAIVMTDQALARLRIGGAGAAETAAEQLHDCVTLTAATRGRVPAQRLRMARMELRPWRREGFVADLDEHIHSALVGA